jgi:low temperature requirement protein LtrA
MPSATNGLRAAVEDPAGRRTALRYATGITIMQVGWVLRLVLSETGALPSLTQVPFFAGLAVLELAVPRWAERITATSWHPHHIAERYGLFTIILLGESVLAASRGVAGALETSEISVRLVVIAISGLVLLFALIILTLAGKPGRKLRTPRASGRFGSYVSQTRSPSGHS